VVSSTAVDYMERSYVMWVVREAELFTFSSVCGRNFHRSGNTSAQLYGRGRSSRGRGPPLDDLGAVRRGPRTISQSQQPAKLPSQSTDQNLSDVGNEEWETASESSDVLSHHHNPEPRDESKLGGKRPDVKKTFTVYVERNHRDNVGEPRSGGVFTADAQNGVHGARSSSNANGRSNLRGSRDQASTRNSVTSTLDAVNR